MLFVISPAKALDFSIKKNQEATTPQFVDRADRLAQKLKKKSPRSLKKLFHVSEDLAQLNYDRFQNWDADKTGEFGKEALHAFNGHVYQKIEVDTLKEEDISYAQRHLRILSGMYGLLKPTDLILPHRLEMGTKWPVTKKNLYGYWTNFVTKELNKAMDIEGETTLINLASQEYFKVVDRKKLKGRIVDIEFKERRPDGSYAVVSIFAKQARGMMCRYAFEHRVKEAEELLGFDSEGYMYNQTLSKKDKYVFTRG